MGAACVAIVVPNLRKGDRLGAAVFVLIAAAMLRGASELALPAARSWQLARRSAAGGDLGGRSDANPSNR